MPNAEKLSEPHVHGDLISVLNDWLASARNFAVATVVRSWGSSPRPVGSQMLIDENGNFAGSVSGGCIEGALVGEGLAVIAMRRSLLLSYGVSDAQAVSAGLACGGEIQVLVQPALDRALWQTLCDAARSRQPLAVVTRLEDGATVLLDEGGQAPAVIAQPFELTPAQQADALGLLRTGRHAQIAEQTLFVRSQLPSARLFIVGAVHIAQALAAMASLSGFDVSVIDSRRAFANVQRFPGVVLHVGDPASVLTAARLDRRSAVVVLAHDPALDDPALKMALASEAFYIGALGSRKTQQQRSERMVAAGFADQVARINGPVGLPLGGREPGEIAVAILAQMIQSRYAV